MSWSTELWLGLLAGGTIYVGLLAGRFPLRRPVLRTGLSLFAGGILLYLLVEIFGEAAGQTSSAWHTGSAPVAAWLTVLLLGGFGLGLVGLIALTQWMVGRARHLGAQQMSLAIATGIGLHNLSEGLAIGASAASGRIGLAVGLVVGFAAHNATEGFGILGPTVREGERVPWSRLGLLGLIGGGPTFVGVLLGAVWTSQYVSVLVLAVAAGALLYVLNELLAGARKESRQALVASFLVAGLAVGWGTEVAANAATNPAAAGAGQASGDPDGDQSTPAGTDKSQAPAALPADEQHRQDAASTDLLQEKPLAPVVGPDGVANYALTASAFDWQPYPGKVVHAWGYNHQVDGPLLRLRVGQQVALTVHNQLPQPTTVHWHGMAVPNAMDGTPDTQPAIPPGGTFTYRFTVTPQMVGTHFYHSHVNDDFQLDAGLHGPIIVDPDSGPPQESDVDALYQLGSFKVPDRNGKDSDKENLFTMDGKSYPSAPNLDVQRGQRVRLRLVNSSAEEFHTMHLHGYTFTVLARDGNPTPVPERLNTITLGPGEIADIGFTADNPGHWMFHCHVLDHNVNPGSDGSEDKVADMGGLVSMIHVH